LTLYKLRYVYDEDYSKLILCCKSTKAPTWCRNYI